MLIAVLTNKFIVSFITIFGTLSFPVKTALRSVSCVLRGHAEATLKAAAAADDDDDDEDDDDATSPSFIQ